MKRILFDTLLIGIIVLIVVLISKDTQRAYDKCMIENNNNVSFCSKLKN